MTDVVRFRAPKRAPRCVIFAPRTISYPSFQTKTELFVRVVQGLTKESIVAELGPISKVCQSHKGTGAPLNSKRSLEAVRGGDG